LKRLLIIPLLFITHCTLGQIFDSYNGQHIYYEDAFSKISALIDSSSLPPKAFKAAVYEVENAFYDGKLPISLFDKDLQNLLNLIEIVINNDSLEYYESDKDRISNFAAIFKVMTDTSYYNVKGAVYFREPLTYDFNDVFGQEDWTNMFVTKLLATNKGNCHSLPYLYKILAEELGETAHLALAPNHIYISNTIAKKQGGITPN